MAQAWARADRQGPRRGPRRGRDGQPAGRPGVNDPRPAKPTRRAAASTGAQAPAPSRRAAARASSRCRACTSTWSAATTPAPSTPTCASWTASTRPTRAHYDALLHGCIDEAADARRADRAAARPQDRARSRRSSTRVMWIGAYEFMHCLDVPVAGGASTRHRAGQGVRRHRRPQVRQRRARQGRRRLRPAEVEAAARAREARAMRTRRAARAHRAFYVMEVRQGGAAARAQPEVRPGAGRPADDLPEHRRARLHRAAAGAGGRRSAPCATAARSTRTPPACTRCASASAAGTRERFGVDVPARRIVVTAGASAALQLACLALIEAGDEILMPDPSYPCNRHFVARRRRPRRAAADRRRQSASSSSAAKVRAAWSRAHARRAAGLAVQPHRHLDRAATSCAASTRSCASAAASRWSTRSTWA